MENEIWMEQVQQLAQTDVWYQRWLSDVKRLEPKYLEILHSLPQEKQEILDAYIAACEAMESAMIPLAYEAGKRNRKIPPV